MAVTAPGQLPGNLIAVADSDFENGSLTGNWSLSNCTAAIVASPVFSGGKALRITATANGTAGIAYAQVTAYPAVGYTASGYAQASVPARQCQAGVNWFTSGGSSISSSFPAPFTAPQNTWAPMAIAVTSPGTTGKASFVFQVLSMGAGEVAYFDLLFAAKPRAQVLASWGAEPFAAPAFADVSPWVRLDKGISLQRGRQDNISDVQQGRASLTADNSGGWFTAGLSTSAWAPAVKIGRRLQCNYPDELGGWHTRFDGLISELPTAWEGGPGIESLEAIQAADILAWLSRQPPLLSWTQQEMLADSPIALWSLTDSSNVTQATDQAGQGAAPLQVVSQGDGSGAAAAGSGAPLAEVQTSNIQASLQTVQVTTFTNPGSVSWTAPLGTLVSCQVECVAGGTAGTSGNPGGGGKGGEYAEEPALAVTPGTTYTGTVGAGGVPSAGAGGDTTFAGDSVTVTAHGSGSGSSNTVHRNGGSGGGAPLSQGGGGGSSGGPYQAGNNGVAGGTSTAGAGGTAVLGGGGGGAGDASGSSGTPGSAPGGGGGGGGGGASSVGAAGAAGQITITYTYIPPAASQQNSAVSSWLFTPSGSLAARILSGALPQAVTAAAGFAFDCWAGFAALPAASVTTFTTPGSITWIAPPGSTAADVACIAGGKAGTTGNPGAGGNGGEYAEEPALAVTPGTTYTGTVGAAGAPSAGTGGNTTFAGDSVTVTAHGSGSGSSNTVHHNGGSGGGAPLSQGGGGGSSGGIYQAGNPGVAGGTSTAGAGGTAVTGGGAGGGGDQSKAGGTPGSAPGGGGGGGGGGASSTGGAGGPGQITVTVQPGVSCLLTLVQPRGQNAIAVWVTSAGHLQLASTSGYGTRAPTWTTVDAGQVPSAAFHVAVSVAASTGVATLYVNGVSAGTLTLPAGASYIWATIGGAYGSWLGGWNGSAGLLGVYPAALNSTRVGVHHTAGAAGFAGLSTGTMISKIAGYTGLPGFWYTAPSGTSDPSYGLTLTSYYNLAGQQPLTAMQAFEQAEAGVLYVNAAGQLIFADRASRYSAGAAGSAFVLSAGQYEPDTTFKSNDQQLCTQANFATSDIPGGFPVVNAAAEADSGSYVANNGSLAAPQAAPFADATGTAGVYSTDDLMDAGNYAAGVFGQPVPRIPSLTVDLLTQPASQFSIAAFYATDIGSPYQLTGLPSQAPDAAGQPLASYCVIEGVNETIDLQTHAAQLYTSPLAQNAAWIPGDALLGVLGTTDTVGRSRAPSALGPPYPVPTFGATLNRTGSAGAQDWRGLTVNTQNKLTPPLLIAQQAAAQTLTTAAGQPVSFDTLLADTAGGMGSTLTYSIPAGLAGWYWCAAVAQAATGTANLGGLAVWFAVTLSGVASQWHARDLPYLSTAPYTAVGTSGKIGPFSAGDTIQVIAAWSGTATSVPLGTADGGSMLTLMWEGYT